LSTLGITMKAAIIGAPLDLGAGRRGVDMGPSAIRYAGLEERLAELGVDCVDRGNVATAVAEATTEHDPRARFLPAIRATCERIAEIVGAALDEDRIPIVLGRDHSIALGTLGGLAARRGPGAVLWFDAHGDLNTPTTAATSTACRSRPRWDAAARTSTAPRGRCRRSSRSGWPSSVDHHNATAALAVELAASAFGATTL
jgi:arginase family enzyme